MTKLKKLFWLAPVLFLLISFLFIANNKRSNRLTTLEVSAHGCWPHCSPSPTHTPVPTAIPTVAQCKHENAECFWNMSRHDCCPGLNCVFWKFTGTIMRFKCKPPEVTPTPVEPTPTRTCPTPTSVQPTPTSVQPTPTTIEPSPTIEQPTPTMVEPTSTPGQEEPTPTTPPEGEPTNTPAPGPTNTPGPRPDHNTCYYQCDSDNDCHIGQDCQDVGGGKKICRNPNCPEETDCDCPGPAGGPAGEVLGVQATPTPKYGEVLGLAYTGSGQDVKVVSIVGKLMVILGAILLL